MPVTCQELFDRLDRLGIPHRTIEHAAVFTVAESDRLESALPGAHTKNLFVRDAKGRLFLVVAESHTEVHLKTLHREIGCGRLSFGRPDLLAEVLGVPPGSVTALALVNDVEGRVGVVVDARLMGYDSINCHPLRNTATTNIARDDLMRFMRATGHEPRVVDLAAPAATEQPEPANAPPTIA